MLSNKHLICYPHKIDGNILKIDKGGFHINELDDMMCARNKD